MKVTITSVTLSLLTSVALVLLSGCGAARHDLTELVTEGNELRVYEVFGMDCPGCHGGLENLVNNVEGVVTSQASWKDKTLHVVVRTDANLDNELIFAAIREANFTPGKRLE